jgi:hypothetical protein
MTVMFNDAALAMKLLTYGMIAACVNADSFLSLGDINHAYV